MVTAAHRHASLSVQHEASLRLKPKRRKVQGQCRCGAGESRAPVRVARTLPCPTGNPSLMVGTPGGLRVCRMYTDLHGHSCDAKGARGTGHRQIQLAKPGALESRV